MQGLAVVQCGNIWQGRDPLVEMEVLGFNKLVLKETMSVGMGGDVYTSYYTNLTSTLNFTLSHGTI